MDEVRIGVIGCGGMAHNHMNYLSNGSVKRCRYTACADVVPESVEKTTEKFGVEGFTDGEALLDSGLVDAVLIATPHYFHPPYAIAAFQRGIHVLTEKPVSVTAKAAQQMNEAHQAGKQQKPDLKYAAMFQMRTNPHWQAVKRLIDTGRIGNLQRVLWVGTHWFRTQAYYDSGSWRATWKGEGGGVLLNQCPHDLDMLCWLLGAPSRCHSHLTRGKYHQIEVEDEVTAYLNYPNGGTGVFIASTGETPGSNHFEIIGDRGRIQFTADGIELLENNESATEFIHRSTERFTKLSTTRHLIQPPQNQPSGHAVISQNFVDAILDGVDLIAPGQEGLSSVELANAMIFSGIRETPVDLPMDREAYENLLQSLIDEAAAAAG